MADYSNIPVDVGSGDNIKPMYSINRLVNGNAESGTLSPWTASGVTVVDGGLAPSTKTFKFAPNTSKMSQMVASGGTQPPDFKLAGFYLPDKSVPKEAVRISAMAKVTYEYADGTFDTIIVPVRGAVSNGA